MTTFAGRYWRAHEARTTPGCVQQPRIPFAIAATRPRSLRVAARHAAVWVSSGPRSHTDPPLPAAEGAAAIARQLARLEDACAAEGRDPATLDRLVVTGPLLDGGLRSLDAFREVRDAYAAIGITDLVVHWPRASEPYAGDEAILDEIADSREQSGPGRPRPGCG